MILSDKRIMEEMEKGTIKIEPYNRASWVAIPMMYISGLAGDLPENILDAKKHNEIESFEIPEEGFFCTRIFFTWA
jgi:dCTP deaminase